MTVFIGADHRGFDLKNQIMEYLQEKNIRVEDMGNYAHEPEDDFPEFGKKVAQAVLQHPEEHLGIVICGSGLGMSIAANRFNGVRCGLCLSVEQAEHGRTNDHINVLAMASEYTKLDEAKKIVDAFIKTPIANNPKYARRSKQLDEIQSSKGMLAGTSGPDQEAA